MLFLCDFKFVNNLLFGLFLVLFVNFAEFEILDFYGNNVLVFFVDVENMM